MIFNIQASGNIPSSVSDPDPYGSVIWSDPDPYQETIDMDPGSVKN